MSNLTWDVNSNWNEWGETSQPKNKTSEQYNTQVKIFLEELSINPATIKTKSYQIIYNVLTDLRLPEPDEQLRIRTQQQINMIAIILKIIATHQKIDELTIATYTLNKEAFNILRDLIEAGKIERLNLLLASSYSFRAADHLNFMKSEMLRLNALSFQTHLTMAWSHFKITLVRCGTNFYQLEGSLNYSTNNMAEQLLFENNVEMYKKDYDFINKVMKSQTHKALEYIC